ncbi:NAD(P)H-dependent glycerol-3-phosphate dehydrogenase [Salibaculum sp.]|uniref:NAD(P)H-dependent glycerol-3-phosphate dehydrogenase n=1 Tax=Salibaculum sp. TaxID=2855480 RepID=UPI002B4598C3|nr:NAD(P)H-dependent glycerol-3-phosphate dehydrogenase [Salibaculum sp.]HKL68150.1 NAD(P)H-dependent glycerol-3-phosphate dehydrogenase [Salibaculum sp.]
MKIAVAGAGAFGTALAVALSSHGPVTLWARDPDQAADMAHRRENTHRLPGVALPTDLTVTSDPAALAEAETILLAVPAQRLGGWLADHRSGLTGKRLVSCCKGIDLETLKGPAAQITESIPDATPAVLTGPSFAADIAQRLPTALTLACAEPETGKALQTMLSTPVLRLYRTTDVVGAELGGALKNVIAIACGVCIGAGYGESARAALMTRGFAEMQRLGAALGARPDTLAGLSGFGDLALTCTSEKSRNFRYGLAIGTGNSFDPNATVEGAATASALIRLARQLALDLPISSVVHRLTMGHMDPDAALGALLSRPLKEE